MNVTGASIAASGIQVWKGIAPALPIAPIIIRMKARAAGPSGLSETWEMVVVPASDQTIPMPRIMAKSQNPLIRNALVAVRWASLPPSEIRAYSVTRSPSQKKTRGTKLSARTAPKARAAEKKTYA
jgi:hypothetical protein